MPDDSPGGRAESSAIITPPMDFVKNHAASETGQSNQGMKAEG